MAFKKEEFKSMIEREGVMDFIWTRSWEDISGTEVGLYHLANNRWGVVFKITPPVYVGSQTEKKLASLYKVDLPNKSSIQFFSFAGRNISQFKEHYEIIHSNPANIEKQEVMKELLKNTVKWMKKHPNKSVFKRGIDLRLRNFTNLCVVTIPKKYDNGQEISKSEVINIFTRVSSALGDFGPKKFTQQEYVQLMREILVPDMPLWNAPADNKTFLNAQVVDNDSVLVIEEETNTLGIGKMISKDEYLKLNKETIESFDYNETDEDEDEDKTSFFSKLFKRKKKIAEDRKAFTKWHAKVYTTKMYPAYTSLPLMINKFYDYAGTQMEPTVPCPFFASLSVYVEDNEKTKQKVFEKTQWNLYQTASLGDTVRYLPEMRDRANESEAINELLNIGEIPMTAVWSVVLMDDKLTRLNQYGERLKKGFMNDNWILQEEKLIPHWMFLYSLPLQFEPFVLKDHSKRMNTLFTSNCASITPLMTGSKGFGPPLLVYVDRQGQLAGVDIFSSDTNYNFTVVGSSGSGKSYAMANFFMQYLMAGAKIRVIDVGRSYKSLCDLIGGQYIEFTEDKDIRLNFFTNVALNDQGNIHEEELQTIVPLIALMAMQSLSPEDIGNDIDVPVLAGYISKAVTLAFEKRQRNAGMQDIILALQEIQREYKAEHNENQKILNDLAIALYPFGDPSGEYFKYFNGPNNLKFTSDFVVIELEEIDAKEHLKSVVLASIAHTINNEFFLGDKRQSKILVIDEAWSIMDNKIIVRFLETMARRIRKYNGASGIITQTIGDFFKNKATRAIFDSSAVKIFLQQSPESIAAAENNGEMNLNKDMINLMTTIKSKPPFYSELLIKQDNGMFFVGRLITDKVQHWLITNHPKDMKEIFMVAQKYDIAELDSRMIIGYSNKDETTIEEEYVRRLNAGKLTGEVISDDFYIDEVEED
jgi:conjugal transfer ATP-binding protein TraC